MECAPDLAFITMPSTSIPKTELYALTSPSSSIYSKVVLNSEVNKNMRPAVMIKPRKTNFTSREVEVLLLSVSKRRETVLFGVAGGQVWARAWQAVAQEVSAVEGIRRTEGDVRKKWTYLKWEAKNTSKPGRDPTSRAVLEILTCGDPEASAKARSLLEELFVPPQNVGSPISPQPNLPSVPAPVQKRPVPIAAAPAPSSPKQTPSEVCLRWNSYHSNMQAVFPSLLSNEQFVDVTLACEGQSIKCHKVMLSACSSYFEELLSQNPCQHPIVFMKDLRFWEVQALVDFMYRGEVNVAQEKLPSLLAAAEALQIKGLAGPSSTSSSHDEDSLPSASESLRDEPQCRPTTPSPAFLRRMRKRKSTSCSSSAVVPGKLYQFAKQTFPGTSQTHDSQPAASEASRSTTIKVETDTSPPSFTSSSAKIRSESSMQQTVIKSEPLNIDENNDSMDQAVRFEIMEDANGIGIDLDKYGHRFKDSEYGTILEGTMDDDDDDSESDNSCGSLKGLVIAPEVVMDTGELSNQDKD